MKKISVIVPCFNVARYIDRCIVSLVSQTTGPGELEIICVDDASTDDTWQHLQRWEQRYPDDIILIRQETNKRQGAARNLGLAYASSEWITFVDADDWLEPDCFERLYELSERFECDVVSCRWGRDASDSLTCFGEDQKKGEEDQYIIKDTTDIRRLVFVNDLVEDTFVMAKMIRKSLLLDHQLYFPENLTYEDMYWMPLLNIYTKKIYRTGRKLYHYFLNPASTSLSLNADHHMDWLTVQMKKWEDYHMRGIWKEYREEMEFDCLMNAVGFLKLLVLRYEEPPFSLFQLERQLVSQYIPDYKENRYLPVISEVEEQAALLDMLRSVQDRKSFQNMAETIRKMYWN